MREYLQMFDADHQYTDQKYHAIYLHMETRILLYKLLLTQSVKIWQWKITHIKRIKSTFRINTTPQKPEYSNQHVLEYKS